MGKMLEIQVVYRTHCVILSSLHSPLPHSLHTDNVEVCLFSKEESSKVKEILKTKDVKSVKKVCILSN